MYFTLNGEKHVPTTPMGKLTLKIANLIDENLTDNNCDIADAVYALKNATLLMLLAGKNPEVNNVGLIDEYCQILKKDFMKGCKDLDSTLNEMKKD